MRSGKTYNRSIPDRRIPEPCRGFRKPVSEWPICSPVIRDPFNSGVHAPVRPYHPFENPQTAGSSST